MSECMWQYGSMARIWQIEMPASSRRWNCASLAVWEQGTIRLLREFSARLGQLLPTIPIATRLRSFVWLCLDARNVLKLLRSKRLFPHFTAFLASLNKNQTNILETNDPETFSCPPDTFRHQHEELAIST